MGTSYFYQSLVVVISEGMYPRSPEREAEPLKLKSLTSGIRIITSVTEVSSGNENMSLYCASEEKQLGCYQCLATVLYDTCAW